MSKINILKMDVRTYFICYVQQHFYNMSVPYDYLIENNDNFVAGILNRL